VTADAGGALGTPRRLKFAPDAPAPNYVVDYNKPPTMPMLVAVRSVDAQRIPKMMKWGLIPHSVAVALKHQLDSDFRNRPKSL
jgi:putative SOS response-associated peptidase YedK